MKWSVCLAMDLLLVRPLLVYFISLEIYLLWLVRSHHIVEIGDLPQPSSLGHPSDEKVIRSLDITHQEPKQDILPPPEGPPNTVVQDGRSNSYGFISPIMANPNVVHSKESEHRARDSSLPPYFAVSPYHVVFSSICNQYYIHVFVFSETNFFLVFYMKIL